MNITLLILALAALAILSFAWISAKIETAKRTARINKPYHTKGVRRRWRKVYLMPLVIQRVIGLLPGRRAPSYGVQFANIGEGTFEHGLKSYIPDSGTAARYLMYKIGSTADNCVVCGAGDTPLGSSDDLADANNLDLPITIKLFGSIHGTTRVVTDGTVANGNYVKCAANGQVTVANNGDVVIGKAIFGSDTSANAGDPITVVPILPGKHPF